MAVAGEDWKREEGEEDDEIDETEYKSAKDAVLFAIEVSPSMLEPPPPSDSKKADKDNASTAALKCAYQMMQQRIISNPSDMMGVLLFGTSKSKLLDEEAVPAENAAFPHCYVLVDLDVPSASDVKALKMIVEDEEEAQKLLIPSEEEVAMTNLLFGANQIFTRKAPNFSSRRLFIITDRDDPHTNDKAMRSSAATRAKDLYDLGISIELFPISRQDHDFDRTRFYDDIIYRDPADSAAPQLEAAVIKRGMDGITLLQSLISNVNSKQTPKRALFSNLPLEIGPGLKISVSGFNVLSRQAPARSCYVYMDGPEAQVVKGQAQRLEAESARSVAKAELRKAYKFGGSQVLFTPEELKMLKDFGPSGIRIIGYRPASSIPLWASVNKSTFIYPSEAEYVGSTRVFSALWNKLLKDDKVGIAWFIARANARPQVVAVIPSPAPSSSPGSLSTLPAGLWLYPLPFADDVREPPKPLPPMVASDDLTNRMRTVIQQLQLPGAVYDPSRYPNPSLQWHYRILQCMALDEEIPTDQDKDDKTLPRYRQIDKRAGGYVVEWEEQLDAEVRNSQHEMAGKLKREGPDSSGSREPSSKKVKIEGGGGAVDASGTVTNAQLRSMMGRDALSKITVAELKSILTSRGLSVVGKKAELVDRLEQWLESPQGSI